MGKTREMFPRFQDNNLFSKDLLVTLFKQKTKTDREKVNNKAKVA